MIHLKMNNNMQTTKTIGQWLEELPSPHNEQAKDNTFSFNRSKPSYSLIDALKSAFSWDDSVQGRSYWRALHNSLLSNDISI